MTKHKPSKRAIDSLNSIIGRLEDWQHRYPDISNQAEPGKRELLRAIDRLEQQQEAA